MVIVRILYHFLQDGSYTLGHIDLHWDNSEHIVNGEHTSDMEMQLIHYDMAFDSYEEASKIPGATLSLGLLFRVSVFLRVIGIRTEIK